VLNEIASKLIRACSARPCFRIYGRASFESDWRVIDILATHRRDLGANWPFWAGTCITWTSQIIAVGWDFAENVLREQSAEPASRDHPVSVAGGQLAGRLASASEILAHECGHTGQAHRWGGIYWPIGGAFTLFREGAHWWNWFENQASATGQFGGIVSGSVWSEGFSTAT
jgi:hypothetical protein